MYFVGMSLILNKRLTKKYRILYRTAVATDSKELLIVMRSGADYIVEIGSLTKDCNR